MRSTCFFKIILLQLVVQQLLEKIDFDENPLGLLRFAQSNLNNRVGYVY